jgi:predicted metal-dependent hydrolase
MIAPNNTTESKDTISQTPFDIPLRRDIRWDFSDVPQRFIDEDILVNHLWLALSIGAPGLERFFIKALRPIIPDITDTKLRADTKNMLTQEAMHSAAHFKFNNHMADQNIDLKSAYAHVDEEVLAWLETNHTTEELIGIVAAGEHMLFSFANVYLNSEEIRQSMSPQARRLFDYHSLEEAEHGAVSHDLYRYFLGDGYWMRLRTSLMALHGVWKLISGTMLVLIETGEEKITWKNRIAFLHYCLLKPGIFRKMGGRMLSYLSPWYKLTFDTADIHQLRQFEKRVYSSQPQS